MKEIKTRRGFTIIEVVLVLAIAGLIFLMVFIALPALQRNQRDTQRRDDVARFMAQISQYQTNNRGNVPPISDCSGMTLTAEDNTREMGRFLANYMKQEADSTVGEFQDPRTGENYAIFCAPDVAVANVERSNDDLINTRTITYMTNAKCDGEIFGMNEANRSIAVRIKLEGSGYFCEDNQ